MNYYIDFDNTLYNTTVLKERMLNSIVDSIIIQTSLSKNELYNECNALFNKDNIYNIYELAKYLSNKYNSDFTLVMKNLNNIILYSSDLVYEDSIPFLNKLKEKDHKIYMLSHSGDNSEYQSIKIAGSKLANLFDALFITAVPKYTLDIDYTNGIFIDDNPSDLLGLYSKNAKQVIRLRRPDNKYSVKDINNPDIKEYLSFDEINIL